MRRLRLGDKILRIRGEPEPPPSDGRPPLVCIHGAGSSSVMFMDLIRRVAPARRVIALDLPGHGQSDPWHDEATIDGYCDAVGTVCARLSVKRAVLLGHSMGAAVALRSALRFPEHTAGLVLIAGSARLSVDADMLDLLSASLPKDGVLGDATLCDRMPDAMAQLSFSPSTKEEVRARWQAMIYAATRAVILGDFRACDGFDVRKELASLRTPSLCVGGADDLLVPPARIAETAAAISGALLSIIQRAGHLPHIERPDAFHQALDPFLRAI